MDEEKTTSVWNQEKPQKGGKALEICALVFGILAVAGCSCGGIFGVVGLVLSIIALATGKKSGFTTAGLICSIVGLLLSIALIGYLFSSEGQNVIKEIQRGVNDAYEDNYREQIEDLPTVEYSDDNTSESDDDTEHSGDDYGYGEYETHNGSATVSDEEIGTVILGGTTVHLPVKFSDIRDLIEVDESSQKDLTGEVDGNDSKWIYLATDGKINGIMLVLSNNTETGIPVDDAEVSAFEVSSWGDAQADIIFYGGIKTGQSEKEFLDAIKDLTYTVMEDDGYNYYYLGLGDDEEYSLSVSAVDGVIDNMGLSYYHYD